MANEVFISYSRKDFEKVRTIKKEIDKSVGIDCWMDLNGIESGDRFKKVIISAINCHDALLFMLTPQSMNSPVALKELAFAASKGKRIVLVNLEHTQMNDEFYFDYSDKDIINWDDPLQHDKLIKDLKSWFSKKNAHEEKQKNTYKIEEDSSYIGKKDVYVCFHQEKETYAKRLYQELIVNNFETNLFLSNIKYEIGEDYIEKTKMSINECKCFLLIYSSEIEDSTFIINQIEYAVSRNKPVFIYPLDNIDINNSNIRNYLSNVIWIGIDEESYRQFTINNVIDEEKYYDILSAIINEKKGLSVYEDLNIIQIRVMLQKKLRRITFFGNYRTLCNTGDDTYYNNQNFQLRVISKSFFLNIPNKYRTELEKLLFLRKDKLNEFERILSIIQPDENDIKNQLYSFVEKHYKTETLYVLINNYIRTRGYENIELPLLEHFNIDSFLSIITEIVSVSFIEELQCGKLMWNGTELGVYSISDNRTTNSEEHCVDMQLYYSDFFTYKCMTEMYHILCSIDDRPFVINSIRETNKLAPFLCSLGIGGFLAAYTENGISLMWTKHSANMSFGDMWHFSYDETISLLLDSVKEDGRILIDNNKNVHIDINRLLTRTIKEEVGITQELLSEDRYGIFEIGIIQSERLEIEIISEVLLHPKNDYVTLEEKMEQMFYESNDYYRPQSEFLSLRNSKGLIGKILSPESYIICLRMRYRLRDNVGKNVFISSSTSLAEGCYVDDNTVIGERCNIHRNVYVGKNVKIGNGVEIFDNNYIFEGIAIDDGVFIGPNVSFMNTRYPRSSMIVRSERKSNNYKLEETQVCYGASIGAGAVVLCGVTIGKYAMVAAGSVVLEDVPDGAMVAGNPAKVIKNKVDY